MFPQTQTHQTATPITKANLPTMLPPFACFRAESATPPPERPKRTFAWHFWHYWSAFGVIFALLSWSQEAGLVPDASVLGPYKGLLAMAGGAVLFAWGPYNDYGMISDALTQTVMKNTEESPAGQPSKFGGRGSVQDRGGALARAAPLDGVSAPAPVVNSHCRSPLLMSPSMMQNDSASASQLARGVLRKEPRHDLCTSGIDRCSGAA
jgi:hypothetical protein